MSVLFVRVEPVKSWRRPQQRHVDSSRGVTHAALVSGLSCTWCLFARGCGPQRDGQGRSFMGGLENTCPRVLCRVDTVSTTLDPSQLRAAGGGVKSSVSGVLTRWAPVLHHVQHVGQVFMLPLQSECGGCGRAWWCCGWLGGVCSLAACRLHGIRATATIVDLDGLVTNGDSHALNAVTAGCSCKPWSTWCVERESPHLVFTNSAARTGQRFCFSAALARPCDAQVTRMTALLLTVSHAA